MRNLTTTLYLTLVLLLGSTGASWGNDFLKGLNAYHSGDFATALREWKPLAEQGDPPSQYNLGFMHYKGEGVPQDYKTAVKWYTLAAEQGHADGQFRLGVMYWSGKGVLQDYKAAVKWYTLAAEQGDSNAQNTLGVMYANGRRVPEDLVYAHMWYNLAASNGSEMAEALRCLVEEKMTLSQIEEAQALAREFEENQRLVSGTSIH